MIKVSHVRVCLLMFYLPMEVWLKIRTNIISSKTLFDKFWIRCLSFKVTTERKFVGFDVLLRIEKEVQDFNFNSGFMSLFLTASIRILFQFQGFKSSYRFISTIPCGKFHPNISKPITHSFK